MHPTKIPWADFVFNPLTGCYHDCAFGCYAERLSHRFVSFKPGKRRAVTGSEGSNHPVYIAGPGEKFPMGFAPTLYPHRLLDPIKRLKPTRIFVCSMGDLFGDWVPPWYLNQIMETVAYCQWHRFIFLTKNYGYHDDREPFLQTRFRNCTFGISVTNQRDVDRAGDLTFTKRQRIKLLSIEPLLGPIHLDLVKLPRVEWIIIGGLSKPSGKISWPEPIWVDRLIDQARMREIPVFLKENVRAGQKHVHEPTYPYRQFPSRLLLEGGPK